MTNPTEQSQPATPQSPSFNWTVFANRMLKAGFALLVFGAVFILLINFNGVVNDIIPSLNNPYAFAAGAIVLVALSLLGVATVPAAIAGFAAWVLIERYF